MPIRMKSGRHRGFCTCLVTEIAEGDQPGLWKEVSGQSLCTGEYFLEAPDLTKLLQITPLDGHWSMVVEVNSPDMDIQMVSMGDTDLPWWQQLVGAKRRATHSAKGIKVGIIDLLFKPDPELKHLNFVDSQRLAQWASVIGAEGHGQQVSAVLAGRGPGAYRGLASSADIFFIDASVPDGHGSLSRVDVDHARVLDGVRNLSKNHRVDIINLSCGFGSNALPDLEDAIEEAADLGTLCICAAGNSGGQPVEVPARYNSTIAVGGIGFTGVADQPTCLGHNAAQARADGLLGTFVSKRFGLPFVDTGTCNGPELGAFSPSMGVVIKSSTGTIFDCNGTSYAAPIVTSVIACALAKDQIYGELTGRERHEHARRRLDEISVDLGLPFGGSSAGLPVLQS